MGRSTVQTLADFFKLLSDSTRLLILQHISSAQSGRLNVGEICLRLNIQSQPAVSHHLALMRVSGIIQPTREGKNNYYSISIGSEVLAAASSFLASCEGQDVEMAGVARQAAKETRAATAKAADAKASKSAKPTKAKAKGKPSKAAKPASKPAKSKASKLKPSKPNAARTKPRPSRANKSAKSEATFGPNGSTGSTGPTGASEAGELNGEPISAAE